VLSTPAIFLCVFSPLGDCWVCVIFFACVCVGASDSITASDDPKFLHSLCRVRRALSYGGQVCPPWLRVAFKSGFGAMPQNCCLGGFCYFSGFFYF
jgi:hypothetical protein